MTIGLLFSTLLLLALLTALAYGLRGLGRVTRQFGRASSLPLELVDRIPVAPKQGVAIVRVGERALLVSVGDGGVHSLLELNADECALLPIRAAQAAQASRLLTGLTEVLRRTVSSAGRRTALVVALAVLGAAQPRAATAGTAPPAAEATQQATPRPQPAPNAAAVAPQLNLQLGNSNDSGLRVSGTVGSVIMIGLLALLPALLLLMTSFTRILIVLHFLRQALGTQSAPPGQMLAALALILTGFVMAPTLERVNGEALQPWMNGELAEGEMLKRTVGPLREFMIAQTPERDLVRFVDMSGQPAPASAEEVSLPVLVSAFATSELRAAFQMGFAIFLPFIVIDLVVSAVLTSMGMFMLPPTMIALPCKLLLFVLADGWTLTVQSLVSSFR